VRSKESTPLVEEGDEGPWSSRHGGAHRHPVDTAQQVTASAVTDVFGDAAARFDTIDADTLDRSLAELRRRWSRAVAAGDEDQIGRLVTASRALRSAVITLSAEAAIGAGHPPALPTQSSVTPAELVGITRTALIALANTSSPDRSRAAPISTGTHAPMNAEIRTSEPSIVLRLQLSDAYGAGRVAVAGDFTAWTPVDVPYDGHGSFTLEVTVPRDRRWRYRFCLDDTKWINDPMADDYELDADGSGISVRHS
jgi:hypothetical protein